MENQNIICHALHLNKEQRYAIHNCEPVEVVGNYFLSSIDSSDPVKEIFVKYNLKKEADDFLIEKKNYGFEVNFPKTIPIEENYLTKFFKIDLEFNTKKLLNINDGGSEFMFIKFYKYKVLNLMQISTKELLEFSCFL
jgi:hypothetical protein